MGINPVEAEKLIKGELIVGNHDTITLYGADIQSKVADISRNVSELIISGNDELEYLLNEITVELEEFQSGRGPKLFGLFGGNDTNAMIKKYYTILAFLDKASLALKLQEAQLIKDCKLIEQILPELERCEEALEEYVSGAEKIVSENALNDADLEKWHSRLTRKVEDLRISSTVTQQNKVQLNMMLDNNRLIIDQIVEAINGTIPAWRNQVSILLGIEKMSRDMAVQRKVIDATEKYMKDNKRSIKRTASKIKKSKEIDVEQLKSANIKLSKVIENLAIAETKDKEIRSEMRSLSLS